eukprot:gene9811-1769_t
MGAHAQTTSEILQGKLKYVDTVLASGFMAGCLITFAALAALSVAEAMEPVAALAARMDPELPSMASMANTSEPCSVESPCANNRCCSQWGVCGITIEHCGAGCLGGPCTGVSVAAAAGGTGLQHLAFSAVGLPFGLFLVYLSCTDLFAANIMYCTASLFRHQERETGPRVIVCLNNFLFTFFGNIMGVAAASYVISVLTGMVDGPAAEIYAWRLSEWRVEHFDLGRQFITNFLRGIGGGWLVSLGFMFANCAPDLLTAFLSLWTPTPAVLCAGFVAAAARLEHVMSGSVWALVAIWGRYDGPGQEPPPGFGHYAIAYLVAVTLGHLLSISLLVCLFYWYIDKRREKLIQDSEQMDLQADHVFQQSPSVPSHITGAPSPHATTTPARQNTPAFANRRSHPGSNLPPSLQPQANNLITTAPHALMLPAASLSGTLLSSSTPLNFGNTHPTSSSDP